jgi:hypothetical protein
MILRPPNIMVLGLSPNRIQAEAAIEALVSATFPESKLSILIPDKPTTTDFDCEKNGKAPPQINPSMNPSLKEDGRSAAEISPTVSWRPKIGRRSTSPQIHMIRLFCWIALRNAY